MGLTIYLHGPNLCRTDKCESCGNEDLSIHPIEIARFSLAHNLTEMADEAFLYDCMWRPEENGIEFAYQIIPFLQKGLDQLERNPYHFKIFNPKNGYGTYDHLLKTVREYLIACEKNPTSRIEVCR